MLVCERASVFTFNKTAQQKRRGQYGRRGTSHFRDEGDKLADHSLRGLDADGHANVHADAGERAPEEGVVGGAQIPEPPITTKQIIKHEKEKKEEKGRKSHWGGE